MFASSYEEKAQADHRNVLDRGEGLLRQYLSEMGKAPLLTREREVELSKLIHEGRRKIGQVQKMQRHPHGPASGKTGLKDFTGELKRREAELRAAEAEMVQCNLRLVVSIAKAYVGRGLPFLDLIQEGSLGLMTAVRRYDYRKGFRFSTYASWWIRQALIRALANGSRIVRIPIHMLERRRKLDKARGQLAGEFGRDPESEEVAKAVGLAPKRVREVLDLTPRSLSLETPLDEEGQRLEDLLGSERGVNLDEPLILREMAEKARELLSLLEPREREILRLRFGIGEPTDSTLEQVGNRFGICRERVRQIEEKALKRLRCHRRAQVIRDILSAH